MKALIQKELRENLKLAALGLVVFSAILTLDAHGYSLAIKSQAAGGGFGSQDILQPLVSGTSLALIGYFCAIFGALLGWFQIHNERQRDLWAFLVHRPVTRTQIFFGKIIAGLMLYVLVAGLPLAGYLIWILTPGHVAAPFEWTMLQPVTAFFFSGFVYVLAGMLTGLRQARWYASRALGLGLAGLVSAEMLSVPYFWQALAVILIGGGILATAVWGGFHSNGYYRGQPAPGKPALIATLIPGCAIVLALGFAFVFLLLLRIRDDPDSQYYRMNKDGAIYKIIHQSGKSGEIVDLENKPVVDPVTGRTPKLTDFDRRMCNWVSAGPRFNDRIFHYRWSDKAHSGLFTFYQTSPGTFWYYWNRYGRLVGYDMKTRQFIGSLGPDGFSAELSGNEARFDVRLDFHESFPGRVISDGHALYEPDLGQRTVKLLFDATSENCEASRLTTNQPERIIGAVRQVSRNRLDWNWDYTMVVTRCFIRLLTPDGKVVWAVPYQPADPEYSQVQVACLEPTNQFALWLDPSRRMQTKAGGKLPVHVTWLGGNGDVLKSVDLPDISFRIPKLSCEEKVMSVPLPPALTLMLPLLNEEPWPETIPWVLVNFSLAAALVCLPIGWWLGSRYSLSLPARLGWSVFILLFGIPGLLVLLSVEEWPARETCPACRKLRVVDREKCEHCGADFAPPDKNGTEIFEPLAAVK